MWAAIAEVGPGPSVQGSSVVRTCLVAPQELDGGRLAIAGDAYRHLFRAARLAVGDELRLVDGEGRARRGRVATVGRRSAEIELAETLPGREPALELAVWSPFAKASRTNWMIEKLTELGAHAVRFYRCRRAPRQPGDEALERLRRVAGAAVEQCGRSRLPEVSGPHAWAEVVAAVRAARRAWILDSAGAREPAVGDGVGAGLVVVGPEGGLIGEERGALEAAGGRGLALGPITLRIETAAVVGTGLLLAAAARAGAPAADEREGVEP